MAILQAVYKRRLAEWTHIDYPNFAIKLVAMATSLEESEKGGPDRSHSCKYLSISEKNSKNWSSGYWDNCSQIKKKNKEMNAIKIYSPVGKFVERAKYNASNYIRSKSANETKHITW